MTTADLIANVLGAIRGQFYTDRDREFSRDYQALQRALSWWGKECHSRGWDFDAAFIQEDILKLLNEIKRQSMDIVWLPKYLEGAIRKRIRVRAEELSATWKSRGAVTGRVIKEARNGVVTAIVQPSDTEILAKFHAQLKQADRERKVQRAPKQGELL